MSRDREALLDIVQAARLALAHVAGKTREEFLRDTQCQGDICRRISVIGEAVRRLSDDARASTPGIPWSRIAGMRNRLIHEYDHVDFDLVWDTVRSDLPVLVAALEGMFPEEAPG